MRSIQLVGKKHYVFMGLSTSFCMVWIYKTEKMEKNTHGSPFSNRLLEWHFIAISFTKISTHLQLLTTSFQIFAYAKPNGFYRVLKVKHAKSDRQVESREKKKDWSTYWWPEMCVFTKRRHHQDPHITSKATRLSTTESVVLTIMAKCTLHTSNECPKWFATKNKVLT